MFSVHHLVYGLSEMAVQEIPIKSVKENNKPKKKSARQQTFPRTKFVFPNFKGLHENKKKNCIKNNYCQFNWKRRKDTWGKESYKKTK